MELDVPAPKHRNSRTAWPNSSAPSRQAANAPPNTDRQSSKDWAAMRFSWDSGAHPSKGKGNIASTSVSLCAAVRKTQNRTIRPSALVDGRTIIAR
jgi:hypothetical protein